MAKKRNSLYEKLYEIYLTGFSLQQLSKKFNVTRQGIYKAFKLRGFRLRNKNFQAIQYFDNKKFTLRKNGYYGLTTNDRILMHRYIWRFYNGKIPKGYDIHHKDFDKANNDIENLECILKSEHTKKFSPNNNQYTKGRKIQGKCRL